jgi:hypothetical protein
MNQPTQRPPFDRDWPALLAADLRTADPCSPVSLTCLTDEAGEPAGLRLSGLATCAHGPAAEVTARLAKAVGVAADQRGLPVVVDRPEHGELRALYLRGGYKPSTLGGLVRRPAPPPTSWRLSAPDQPRSLLLYRGDHPVVDPPCRRTTSRQDERLVGHVVHLRRRRDAPLLLSLLHCATVHGVLHGRCEQTTPVGAVVNPCPPGTPHTHYYVGLSGDLNARSGGANRCLISRDQQPRRTLDDMEWALGASFAIGCGNIPDHRPRPA